jgi:hypothetical protein
MMLGYDERHWFDILKTLGCYASTGTWRDVEDHTEHMARTGNQFTARFPNGSLSIAPHLRHLQEQWPGGFRRDAAEDRAIVARLDLPSEELTLEDFKVNGTAIDYRGSRAVSLRTGKGQQLAAFAGHQCERIRVNGRETIFADRPLPLVAWAPVPQDRRVAGGAVMLIRAAGDGELRIPARNLNHPTIYREGRTAGSRGSQVESRYRDGQLVFQSAARESWYYVVDE